MRQSAACLLSSSHDTVSFGCPLCRRYRSLCKPWFTPPDAVFGIVWTVLYTCMGLAANRVYAKVGWPSWALQVRGGCFTDCLSRPQPFLFIPGALSIRGRCQSALDSGRCREQISTPGACLLGLADGIAGLLCVTQCD